MAASSIACAVVVAATGTSGAGLVATIVVLPGMNDREDAANRPDVKRMSVLFHYIIFMTPLTFGTLADVGGASVALIIAVSAPRC
jgi:hypothetical protein